MNFSLAIDVMMAESTINSLDQDTQGPPGLNTFLNLFNHWLLDSKYNFTPIARDIIVPLEDWFGLWCCKRTNNITN